MFEVCGGVKFVLSIFIILLASNMFPSSTQVCSQPLKVKINYIQGQPTCLSKLQQVRTLLLENEPPSANYVQEVLGHGVLAGT